MQARRRPLVRAEVPLRDAPWSPLATLIACLMPERRPHTVPRAASCATYAPTRRSNWTPRTTSAQTGEAWRNTCTRAATYLTATPLLHRAACPGRGPTPQTTASGTCAEAVRAHQRARAPPSVHARPCTCASLPGMPGAPCDMPPDGCVTVTRCNGTKKLRPLQALKRLGLPGIRAPGPCPPGPRAGRAHLQIPYTYL